VIFLIFSGVLLMVATETKFVLEGLILVLTASAFGGLRWSLTQILLQNKEMGFDNILAGAHYGHHACFAQCCGGALGCRFQQPLFSNIRQSVRNDIFHFCTWHSSFLHDYE
jgi:hypothetical protein